MPEFVDFDEVSRKAKWVIFWGIAWRQLVAGMAGALAGGVCGAILGFLIGLFGALSGMSASAIMLTIRITAGISGLPLGGFVLWQLIRWLLRAKFGDYSLKLIRESDSHAA